MMNMDDVEIAYSNFYRFDEEGLYYNQHEKYYHGDIQNELLKGWCPATTSLFCIKKSILSNIGGFDENLKNLEEYDLWIRLSRNHKFGFCKERFVIKTELLHEQLTNNYDSRIQAWKDLKEKWLNRDLSNKESFFQIIDQNIVSDSYHKDLQSFSKFKNLSNYGLKRRLLLIASAIFGTSVINYVKHTLSKKLGHKIYLSKPEENKIKKAFGISYLK